MSIQLIYCCDGCGAEARSGRVARKFESFNGQGYGFGVYRIDADPVRDAPDGWIAFCIIGCTYCPSCADGMEEAS